MPDLRESFSSRDKKPFGTFVTYQLLEKMFSDNTIRIERRNFENSWKNLEDTGCTYICVAGALYTTDEDVTSVMNFVKKGNDVFIAASGFDSNLLDRLECKVSVNFPVFFILGKPYQYTGIKAHTAGVLDSIAYRYFYFPFYRSFSEFNKTNSRVLGVNENNEPDLIVIFKGRGRIFLHCEPRAFSNYFLLQRNNYQYLQKIFGYLSAYPDHIYWNDYYSKLRSKAEAGNNKDESDGSSLDVLLSYPPLAAAFWLAFILFLLYLIFGSKRRQRIIDIIKPNENTTVTFTETIGRLYLQKKDNKNIADKMITYFNEYIRNTYFLNTNLINDDFITTLSRKSGVLHQNVEVLYRTINHAHANTVVDDYQLLSLNEQIQNFYKTSN